MVRFLEREVDLRPFMEGFPYSRFRPSLEHGRMFFMDKGERYTLRSLPLPGPDAAVTPLDLAHAEAVTEVD